MRRARGETPDGIGGHGMCGVNTVVPPQTSTRERAEGQTLDGAAADGLPLRSRRREAGGDIPASNGRFTRSCLRFAWAPPSFRVLLAAGGRHRTGMGASPRVACRRGQHSVSGLASSRQFGIAMLLSSTALTRTLRIQGSPARAGVDATPGSGLTHAAAAVGPAWNRPLVLNRATDV